MNWALKRQLIYFLIVFAIVVLVVLYIVHKVFFSAAESCFDRKQNQDERGVDCGGSCQLVCQLDARNLIVRWAKATPVTDEVYNAVAYVENQNVAAGVRSIGYEFKLYDDRNILITERTGHAFIGPNQRTAIFEPSLPVGTRVPQLTQFLFTEFPVWETTDEEFRKRLLTIEEPLWSQLDTNPKLTARVRNPNTFNLDNVRLIALAYDEEGNLIASSGTIVDRIVQGSLYDVTFTWPKPFTIPVIRTEIVPRINPFSR